MPYTISHISSELHRPIHGGGDTQRIIDTLVTDSRSVRREAPNCLFFALRTATNDGHRYVHHVFDKGVRCFVVEDLSSVEASVLRHSCVVEVGNSLEALQQLAAKHRRQFHIPVVAITGSLGKTTVKEWLYQMLWDRFRIARSPRSYNSQIGVPLSLWEIGARHELAIIEAGISTMGEMRKHHDMISPTIGVITGIGIQHDAGFANRKEKMREKAQLLRGCDTAIYCLDNEELQREARKAAPHATHFTWSMCGSSEADLCISDVASRDGGTEFTLTPRGEEPRQLWVPVGNTELMTSVAATIAVAATLGLTVSEIEDRLTRITSFDAHITVTQGLYESMVFADSYPSDFTTLGPALDFMSRYDSTTRRDAVVLSDLLSDSGENDRQLYDSLNQLLCNAEVQLIVGIGPEMQRHAGLFTVPGKLFFATEQECIKALTPQLFASSSVLVKGSPSIPLTGVKEMLEARRHQTVEEINLSALAANFRFFKQKLSPTTRTVAMVKASGYGTGSYEVASTLVDCGADYLAVAAQDEGVSLRRDGIEAPIIVLNPAADHYSDIFNYALEPEIYSIEECRQIIKEHNLYIQWHPKTARKQLPVHIKIDSGMHRLGFTEQQLPQLCELLREEPFLKPVSVFSHLCVADDPSQDDYTREQFDVFARCAGILQNAIGRPLLKHVLNTTGIVRFPEHQLDMVRIGVGLYGIKTVTDGSEDALQPVATLRSVILSIKTWPAGTTIGYGRKGVLQRTSRIATVALGYADGLDRHCGNGNVLVWAGGRPCPIVGNVCMDACMVDVTDAQCEVGDTVEIFGKHIDIETVARARGTIAYEVLTSVSPRVKRTYFRE